MSGKVDVKPAKADHSSLRRIAILGANGRLGKALAARFRDRYQVLEVTRDHLDLGHPESIARPLGELDFDELILTAALSAVDYCESHKEEAYAINADGPREVARVCAGMGVRVTYLSTDFVFDGEKSVPYAEDDAVHPLSVYGASKAKGEEYVLDASAQNLVVRISWLFGPGKPAFPEWIVGKAGSEASIALPGEKLGCPTFSPDLAAWMERLLCAPGPERARGIFHLCNSTPCTWQEWGQACVDLAREGGMSVTTTTIDATSLEAIPAFVAKRPVNSALSTGKYSRLTGESPRSWRSALRDHFADGRRTSRTPSQE